MLLGTWYKARNNIGNIELEYWINLKIKWKIYKVNLFNFYLTSFIIIGDFDPELKLR